MIELKNITKKYGRQPALSQFSMVVPEGSATGLLGANGAGKTTIIHTLACLIKQNKGQVFFDKEEITPSTFKYRKRIGFVLEDPMFIPKLTAKEYLEFISVMYGLTKAVYLSRIDQLIQFFDLPVSRKFIDTYSKGMKKKLSVAAALVHQPEVLILDEPFSDLDIQTIEIIKNLLKRFKGKKTLFITSHNLDLVADICDRFLIIDSGQLIAKLKKSEYENVEQLKNRVKTYMTKKQKDISLSWLS